MDNIDFSYLSVATLMAVYASGFFLSLTPCVYPLIPVVIGYLGNQAGGAKRRLLAASCYVLGLSLVYSALGVAAALTGRIFGEMTTNPYTYIGFGVLLLVLGGTMMDWYPIPLPRILQPKAKAHASLLMCFLVGAVSGLIAGPCSAPVMTSLLFYIGSQKQILRGAVLMLVFALGMNTLFLILGFSAGFVRSLPRPGVWMVVIKKTMAVLLLGSGAYFIFRAGQLS